MSVKRLEQLIPDADVLLALDPAELGGAVLEVLNSRLEYGDGHDRRNKFHYANFVGELFQLNSEAYPRSRREHVERAVMEAWDWLVASGLLAQDQDASGSGWRFVTRRGRALKAPNDFTAYRKASALPQGLLHPSSPSTLG